MRLMDLVTHFKSEARKGIAITDIEGIEMSISGIVFIDRF